MSRADTGEQKSMSGRDKCPEGDKGNGSESSGRRKADRVWLRSSGEINRVWIRIVSAGAPDRSRPELRNVGPSRA